MKVENIGTNPVMGIAPGEVGELPKERQGRIARYEELGMLKRVELEKPAEPEKVPEEKKPAEPKKTTGRPKKAPEKDQG